ncbi:catalase family peroxidase [Roseomonas sp. NAR14]|uniref:Catalase-related peroxidase n=1 Tax=Roseomonas acroporae TaxID=2937791 RepID=A0A9X1Y4Y0_9PROT|nr:catalase family peroxidase [Roseomonas acroporae]MCK8784029.1 catalase family peroxidase [Roseomonas acroporae]
MPQPSRSPPRSALGSLVLIAALVGVVGAAFAYTAGWLAPGRLTPDRLVDSLAPPGGPALGFRRNHAKGICVTGRFEANGAGAALSRAPMLAQGSFPVLGRLNIAGPNPASPDASVPVRGFGWRIAAPDGQEWRSAMIDPPVFPVATPEDFYALQQAAGSGRPERMQEFAAAHPSFGAFVNWIRTAPKTASWAETRFNGLNSFTFTDAGGTARVVRWSLIPAAAPVPVTAEQLGQRGPDFLRQDIVERLRTGPVRWTLAVTVAEPGDPTADPTKPWPAERRTVEVGTLVIDAAQPEPEGACRDLNFDPAVLPDGMGTSDDPFPAARSSAYAKSYDRRTAEVEEYRRATGGGR